MRAILIDLAEENGQWRFELIEVPSPVPLNWGKSESIRRYIPRAFVCDDRQYLVYIWDTLNRYDEKLEKHLTEYIRSTNPPAIRHFR